LFSLLNDRNYSRVLNIGGQHKFSRPTFDERENKICIEDLLVQAFKKKPIADIS
jgi:hypothetical protein